jgi:hypothetical protein
MTTNEQWDGMTEDEVNSYYDFRCEECGEKVSRYTEPSVADAVERHGLCFCGPGCADAFGARSAA